MGALISVIVAYWTGYHQGRRQYREQLLLASVREYDRNR